MNRKRLRNTEAALIMGLLMALLISAGAAFGSDCEDLRGDVLRLHILAASDEARDQQIKLEIRDEILSRYAQELSLAGSREAAEQQLQKLLGPIEETAREVVRRAGRNDEVHAGIVNMYFDTRTYGRWTLPAGCYDAVRITIGEAQGHNWWCVLYPPVCVYAAADAAPGEDPGTVPEGNVTALEDTVAAQDPVLEPRFALMEWIESTAERWREKKEEKKEFDG